MKLQKGILERYERTSSESNFSIEFPKKISKQRIIERAWTWYKNEPGFPGYFNLNFSDALKMSWKTEKDMIKAGGAIYHPYIIQIIK